MAEAYYGTGKRKTAVARTWLKPGKGTITINQRDVDDYFRRETAKMIVEQPLVLTDTYGSFDVNVNVSGGRYFRPSGCRSTRHQQGVASGESGI